MEDAAKLAESTSVLLNVSEFSSIEDATSALTSTMQAFGYVAEDSMHVVDILNEVGNNFAISSDGIATALQDSASALMAANNSYEEAVALIAAANRVVQDPNSVGSALRTISLRLRGTSVKELEDAGEDTTGAITSKSKLRSKVKSLSGVDILTDTGAYKSTYQVLLEISRVWEKMSDIDQAALLEILAGKNRANTAMAILSNTKDLEEAYVSALESEGSALQENEKYLNSIQGKIDLFNNALQTMWSNTLDDSVVKGFVEFGTVLVKLIDKIGLINTLLAGLALKNLIPIILQAATGMGTFGESLSYVWAMMTSIKGTGASLISTIVAQTKALWAANTGASALGLSLKTAGLALKAFVSTPLGWLTIAAVVIGGVVAIVDACNVSLEEQVEILKEAREEYEQSEQRLTDLNSELKTTQQRIKELQSLGALTIVEQEELKRLKAENNELERRLKLEEKVNAAAMRTQAKEAANTVQSVLVEQELSPGESAYIESLKQDLASGIETYGYIEPEALSDFMPEDASAEYLDFMHDYLSDLKERYYESLANDKLKLKLLDPGATDYQISTYTADEINDKLSQWNEADVQSSIDGITDALANIEAAAFGLISDEASGYQTLIDNMEPQYEKIIATNEKIWSDSDKKIVESYQAAQERIKEIWQKYDPQGWTELSVNEVWSDERFEDIHDGLTKLSQDGKLDEEELRKNFDSAIVNALVDACEEKGILLSDLLNDVVVEAGRNSANGAEEESSLADDTLSKIKLLEDAFNSLGDAVQEFKEDGTAAAGTLESLTEVFGETQGFEELYRVLATGEGNVEEAITKVANAYVAQKGILSDVTEEELQIMVARLESLGAINAQEILQNRQKLQQKLDDELQGYNIDLSAYATAEQAKLAIAAMATRNICSAVADMESELLTQYGINLSDFASTEEAKVIAAKKAAKEIAKANKEAALSELRADSTLTDRQYAEQWAKLESEYNQTISSIDSIDSNIKQVVAGVTSTLNDYYNQSFKFDFSGDKIGIGRDYDDDANDGSKDKTNKALETLQKKYERQIDNLSNKQTYLQNQIDLLEAQNEAVSKSYYEEQIRLEQQKLNLYAQELEALKHLERTDEVAEALWETEHAIQESTLRMVEFRKSIIDLYDEAFNGIAQAYDNKDDALEDRQNYIDKYQQLMELQGSPEAATGYNELIQTEEAQLANNIAKLDALIAARDAAYANSDIEELSDEQWIAMEDEIRAVEAAILDNKIALEEYNQELKNLYVEAFNSVRGAFGFKDEFYSNQQSYIEGYADYLEAIGVDAPQELYDTLIEIEQKKRENTLADLVDARAGLADLEAQGFTAADEEWQDAYGKIVELEKKIQDSDIAMAQWEKTLRDMDFEKFERFISRLDDINSEIEHIQNLLADEDVAFEDGTWTEEGITSLGLLYQQMQLAQQKSKEYAEEIDELNATYAEGAMSEQEYYERLQELKEGQWDAIETYEDAKDAIVDMEEARIDMIEEGINEEIEAYQELIDLKKEELDAERDLYEFKKNIQNQTKDIATLERRIAAMSGSTDAATIAERTKLEAELREAQEGLDDTYYSHAKDAQNQALDDEATSYQEAKENYLETLRDALDDTAAIIEAKISEFLLNADVGLEELNGISQEHGITLSDALMLPWQNASEISSAFKLTADENLWSLINEDGVVTIFSNEAKLMLGDVFSSAGDAAQLFNSDVETIVGNIKTIVENSTSPLTANLSFPWEDTASEDGPISTFSTGAEEAIDGVINKAKDNCEALKTYLSSPFTAAETAADTFKTNAVEDLNAVIEKAKEAAREIANAANTETPDYEGTDTGGGGGGGSNKITTPKIPTKAVLKQDTPGGEQVEHLQKILNQFFSAQLKVDGIYGSATKSAVANMQNWLSITPSGKYDKKTKDAMEKWLNQRPVSSWFRQVGFGIPAAMYAKGTLGTKQDELAVVDEIGEELILAAGGNGRLQYLRKGSGVIPASLTENLMEWGKLNPNTDMSRAIQGVNVMTSVLNKPETNLSFENLLHIDNCTNEVLPEVKKIITEQLESFTKKLNYNLKRVGSKA